MWDFCYFVQTLMDNYKPVTIPILYLKKKNDKNAIFLKKICMKDF
jgi:hypothetical protein